METIRLESPSVADAYLALLASRGITRLFGNAGTDFAPLIEALAKAKALGQSAPEPVTIPHENAAMAAGMGAAMVTGAPQLVMLHTNVGLANGLCQGLNANRLNLPLIYSSGRTPINEEEALGARSIDIHWTQEMYDQAGMTREAVKWDYELRNGDQLESVVDRAINMATAPPQGPVYLSLPREVLATQMGDYSFAASSRLPAPAPPAPDPNAVDKLAGWIREAERPVIVTTQLGNRPAAVAALADFAGRAAIPVVQSRPRTMNLPSDHPMHMGEEWASWITEADLVIAIECEVPWLPRRFAPPPDARIVQIALDPTYGHLPIRSFEADLAIQAAADLALQAVSDALGDAPGPHAPARRERIVQHRAARLEEDAVFLDQVKDGVDIHPAWISHCLNEVRQPDAVFLRESPLDLRYVTLDTPRSVFTGASGLGWGLGGAVGASLAAPDRQIIATEGDGAYMYGNPVAAHFASAAMDVPFLTVIFNNQGWEAVRKATHGMYPDGYAAKSNAEPLTDLAPSPDFEHIVRASDGYGEKVTDPADLPAAMDRAMTEVTVNKRQAVLNVVCSG